VALGSTSLNATAIAVLDKENLKRNSPGTDIGFNTSPQ